MIDLDGLAERWTRREPGLSRPALVALLASRAETRVAALARGLMLEIVGWALSALVTGSLLASQLSWIAAACHVYVIALLAATVREFMLARALDVTDPVARLQERFEELRIWRIHRVKWALLAGVILWAPFAWVAWEALTGLRPVLGVWLGVNLASGLVFAGAALWVSHRWRPSHPVWRALSGESLAEAERALACWKELEG